MCCFSRPIVGVSTTQIFARAAKDDRQYLVYSMNLNAKEDLAMVLPIPTPKAAKEDALEFINLKEYPTFFADLLKAFPIPRAKGDSRGGKGSLGEKPKLKVESVGSYEASFVPTRKDFDRLDERFRLPADALKALPATYADWGFAVFKLKAGKVEVHPMAFSFPRAEKFRGLFLPTIHIHDGKVHKTAEFDHVLYCQVSGESVTDWEESEKVGAGIVDLKKAGKLIDGDGHVYRRIVRGRKENKDTWVV